MKYFYNLALFVLLCVSSMSYSCEYVYPVALVNQNEKTLMYIIYQKNAHHLELWLWNPETLIASRALLSTYVPAGLQVWPSGNGFSFIDNGRIRVKSFASTSPQALVLDQPVYDLSLIHWIDDSSWYFSAKLADFFALFHGTLDGCVRPLYADDHADCMYPQKVDNCLFYIQRTLHDNSYDYSVMEAPFKLQEPLSESVEMYHHGSNPIIFLHMICQDEGYFIEHPALVYSYHSILPCSYYYMWREDNLWRSKKLFDFSLPTSLIFSQCGETVLHETLLRLMPVHQKDFIYYCDSSDFSVVRRKAANLDVYAYDTLTGTKQKLTHAQQGQFFFAPCAVDNILYYGGSLGDTETELPAMWMNEQGEVCFDLPKYCIE